MKNTSPFGDNLDIAPFSGPRSVEIRPCNGLACADLLELMFSKCFDVPKKCFFVLLGQSERAPFQSCGERFYNRTGLFRSTSIN